MKIEIGKFYLTRNKEQVVKITGFSSHNKFKFCDFEGCDYTEDGFFHYDKKKSEFDLVKEVNI